MSPKRSYKRGNEIYTGVWLIGLGILFYTGYWWPGIIILIGISMLVRGFFPEEKKSVESFPNAPVAAKEKEEDDFWADEDEDEDEDFAPAFIEPQEEKQQYPVEKLPVVCTTCGGTVKENAHKVEWIDAQTAKCPFCATKIKIS